MTRWKRLLRTFLSGFILPFILLAMALDLMFSTSSSGYQCVGEGMCGTEDCASCPYYEPRGYWQ